MSNLDDILKMFAKTSEEKDIPIGSFLEMARLGKSQAKTQAGSREPDIKEKIKDDKADRKNNSNNIIMNRTLQNNSDSVVKNNSNGKEAFSYDFTAEELVKGFIFSEVLGRPKSKRRDKSFRGRRAR
jgi:hypothetical protein